jgi:predicted ferric reductase
MQKIVHVFFRTRQMEIRLHATHLNESCHTYDGVVTHSLQTKNKNSYLAKIMVEDGDSAAVGATVALMAATE